MKSLESFKMSSAKALGFTLPELLVALTISSGLLMGAVCSFTQLSRTANDRDQMVSAQLEAQSIVDLITPELRAIGNGVPFRQPNFLIGQTDLTDPTVTEPIVASVTTGDQIRFRLNESGEIHLVSVNFDPGLGNNVTLDSVSHIRAGDQIYLSNAPLGRDDGMWGTVASINTGTKTVTFNAGTQYSTGATFAVGSLVEVVPNITYTSIPGFGGISRDDGSGTLMLSPNGQMSIAYLDSAGSPLTLPLVASDADPFPASAIQNVRSIRVSVQVRSSSKLTNGNFYVATAEQAIAIRSLGYNY